MLLNFFLSVLPALVLASSLSNNNQPIPPSKDPWYTAPEDFEQHAPGAILRLRHAPGNLTHIMGNCSAAYNILYRTTNSRYKPSWAVTTVFVPASSATSSQPRKSLLSYQVPYNTLDVDGSPSYSLYSEPNQDIANALGRDWVVTVPDFEGPLAANVAGIQEGHATIDSIRATLAAEREIGLSRDETRTVLWGYSGGSIASEWALELQEQYAPDLTIAGAALGGLVSNNTRCIDTVQNAPLAYIAVGAMVGPLVEYPEAYDRLISQLKTSGPYNKTGFLAAKHMTAYEGFAAFANQSIYDYFVNGEAVLHDPLIRTTLLKNQFMTYHGVPQAPLFIYKAIHDEATPIEDTDDYVQRNCMLMSNILYERNSIGGHIDEMANGNSRAVAWLASVLDGSYATKYQAEGCTIRNVSYGSANTGA